MIKRTSKGAPADPFSTAVRILARHAYSVAGLRRALERKFGETADVEAVIARLRELKYLDDDKFARHYASFLARERGFGRERIRRELKSRLVDYNVIDSALGAAFEDLNEHRLLDRALEKKLRTLRQPITAARLHSVYQSLMRLGFRADDIMKAVRNHPQLKVTPTGPSNAEEENL